MTTILLATKAGIRGAGDGAPDPVGGADVTTMCTHDGATWAVLDEHELWRVDAGSATHVATVPGTPVRCMVSHRGSLWVGLAEAHLARVVDGRVEAVATFEQAPTHGTWHTPWGGPADVWSMAADDAHLYVNVHVGGILVSDNGGGSWRATIDLHHDVHEVAIGPDGTLWAATGERALAESHDGGATWAFHDPGERGTYARAVAPADGGVIVATSSGPFSHDGVVSRFDGAMFTACAGLPEYFDGNVDARRLVARGSTAALAGLDGRVYASGDAGRSWTVVADDVGEVRAVLLV